MHTVTRQVALRIGWPPYIRNDLHNNSSVVYLWREANIIHLIYVFLVSAAHELGTPRIRYTKAIDYLLLEMKCSLAVIRVLLWLKVYNMGRFQNAFNRMKKQFTRFHTFECVYQFLTVKCIKTRETIITNIIWASRKPSFGVCDLVRLKLICSAIETS